jgi:hypothetical protein
VSTWHLVLLWNTLKVTMIVDITRMEASMPNINEACATTQDDRSYRSPEVKCLGRIDTITGGSGPSASDGGKPGMG